MNFSSIRAKLLVNMKHFDGSPEDGSQGHCSLRHISIFANGNNDYDDDSLSATALRKGVGNWRDAGQKQGMMRKREQSTFRVVNDDGAFARAPKNGDWTTVRSTLMQGAPRCTPGARHLE